VLVFSGWPIPARDEHEKPPPRCPERRGFFFWNPIIVSLFAEVWPPDVPPSRRRISQKDLRAPVSKASGAFSCPGLFHARNPASLMKRPGFSQRLRVSVRATLRAQLGMRSRVPLASASIGAFSVHHAWNLVRQHVA
jgi:hypothetical protein